MYQLTTSNTALRIILSVLRPKIELSFTPEIIILPSWVSSTSLWRRIIKS